MCTHVVCACVRAYVRNACVRMRVSRVYACMRVYACTNRIIAYKHSEWALVQFSLPDRYRCPCIRPGCAVRPHAFAWREIRDGRCGASANVLILRSGGKRERRWTGVGECTAERASRLAPDGGLGLSKVERWEKSSVGDREWEMKRKREEKKRKEETRLDRERYKRRKKRSRIYA